ncbi:MAG TPA: 2Fe-2S iron-sulfur cluster-binding protein, partial [Anaerolineales bacterium]|nr:2Fe-2S iron-sulfur cluster-binding protein [Anaerolineales bacterium]
MAGSNPTPKTCQVDLEPIGRRVQVPAGTTLLEAAQSAGIELVAICGGTGSCSTCRVRVASGETSLRSLTEEAELTHEELSAGYRLACQTEALGDVRVDIPPESLTTPQRLQVEGQGVEVDLDSLVYPLDVQVTPPDLYDLRSDLTRLNAALEKIGESPPQVELPVLADLPGRLRSQDWSARLAIRKEYGG